ncbi:MAG: hypothetical protein ACLTTU_16130 [Bilophila wadsworthia]
MRLLTVLLFGVFLVATQVFLVLKAMPLTCSNGRHPVDAVMERQASISAAHTGRLPQQNHTVRVGVDPTSTA